MERECGAWPAQARHSVGRHYHLRHLRSRPAHGGFHRLSIPRVIENALRFVCLRYGLLAPLVDGGRLRMGRLSYSIYTGTGWLGFARRRRCWRAVQGRRNVARPAVRGSHDVIDRLAARVDPVVAARAGADCNAVIKACRQPRDGRMAGAALSRRLDVSGRLPWRLDAVMTALTSAQRADALMV